MANKNGINLDLDFLSSVYDDMEKQGKTIDTPKRTVRPASSAGSDRRVQAGSVRTNVTKTSSTKTTSTKTSASNTSTTKITSSGSASRPSSTRPTTSAKTRTGVEAGSADRRQPSRNISSYSPETQAILRKNKYTSTSSATRRAQDLANGDGRGAAGESYRTNSAGKKRNSSSNKKNDKNNSKFAVNIGGRRISLFWIGLGIYVVILLICSAMFLRYTDKSLIKYENSQADKAMAGIMDSFNKMVKDGTIGDKISLPEGGDFESPDVYKNLYLNQLKDVKAFTYEKNAKSYLSDAPVYDIKASGELVAKLTLGASNERTVFGILTIMDWNIAKIDPVFKTSIKNFTISVPSTYSVTVNNISLDDKYLKSEKAPEGFENVSDYVKIPSQRTYTVKGIVNEPSIEIKDEKGNIVEHSYDDKGNIKMVYSYRSGDIPEERKTMAYDIARTWEDFLTNDLSGEYHGLAKIQKYLIKDSYYWNLASDYAKGADISMMADHTLQNPAYTGLVVDNYVEYTDNCFSCHIYFEKNMLLTRANNKKSTDVIDSTFFFVYYDDTDDGEDNPHWGMVDMYKER